MIEVYGYKKCSTVNKSLKFLKENNQEVDFFDFVAQQISSEKLSYLVSLNNNNIDQFFNNKGVSFRTLELKDKLKDLTFDEKLHLLLSDGKLIKRPLIKINDQMIIGFNEEIIKTLL